MRRKNIEQRLRSLEKKLGVSDDLPVIVLFGEGDEDIARVAKQQGLTIEELKRKIDNNRVGVVRIIYGDEPMGIFGKD